MSCIIPAFVRNNHQPQAELLERIIGFAARQEDISLLLLEGSIARGKFTDELSDLDINIYTDNLDKYNKSMDWANEIGNVLIYQKPGFDFADFFIPTRLVLFGDGQKVDFSFWKPEILLYMQNTADWYSGIRRGMAVLLDRCGLGEIIQNADICPPEIEKPSEEVFRKCVFDFWFEAYYVAKHIKRGDHFLADRILHGYMKDFFLHMAVWYTLARNNWQEPENMHSGGKRLEKWIDSSIGQELQGCFCGGSSAERYTSLKTTIGLFNRMARYISVSLQYEYPGEKEGEMVTFLSRIKTGTI